MLTSDHNKNAEDDLYEQLVLVPCDESLTEEQIVDAYARALCVAAGLQKRHGVLDRILAMLDQMRREQIETN